MTDHEVIAWTRKYEHRRLLLTKELGLADINDIKAAEARGYQQAIDHIRNAYEHDYLRYIQNQANAGHYTQWLNQNELTEVADFLTAQLERRANQTQPAPTAGK